MKITSVKPLMYVHVIRLTLMLSPTARLFPLRCPCIGNRIHCRYFMSVRNEIIRSWRMGVRPLPEEDADSAFPLLSTLVFRHSLAAGRQLDSSIFPDEDVLGA